MEATGINAMAHPEMKICGSCGLISLLQNGDGPNSQAANQNT